MAFSKVPTNWLANWSEDGTNITVPLATFPQLTAAEADATSGDIRDIAYAICHKLDAAWAAKAVADRPSQWSQSSATSVDTNGNLVKTFTNRFVLDVASAEVKAES